MTIQNLLCFLQNLSATASDIECHSINTEHRKLLNPSVGTDKQNCPLLQWPVKSLIYVKQTQGSTVMFPAQHCIFITADHVSNLHKECSGEGKEAEYQAEENKMYPNYY